MPIPERSADGVGRELVAETGNAKREIAAEEFFVDAYETSLKADEVLTEIRVPAPAAHCAQRIS